MIEQVSVEENLYNTEGIPGMTVMVTTQVLNKYSRYNIIGDCALSFPRGNPPTCTHYIASSQTRSYADGSATITVSHPGLAGDPQNTLDVSLSGYLINLT